MILHVKQCLNSENVFLEEPANGSHTVLPACKYVLPELKHQQSLSEHYNDHHKLNTTMNVSVCQSNVVSRSASELDYCANN
jgi:hypothetical protein